MATYRVMVDHDGNWWAIFKGEDIPEVDLRVAAENVSGDGPLIVETWHLTYQPRVKWCGKYDWACDNEGEWHAHWTAARPGPNTAHTLVRAGAAPTPEAGGE